MAEKDILIRYRVDSDELLRADAIMNRVALSTDKADKELRQLTKDANKAGSDTAKAFSTAEKSSRALGQNVAAQNKSFLNLRNTVNSFASTMGVSFDTQRIDSFKEGLKGVSTATQGASNGFKILRVAIAATGIGLLIAAVVSLIAYFKRTDEGAAKLDGIFRAIGNTITVLAKYALDFGKKIFDAFSNPQQAIKDLGQLMVDQIVNRFMSVGVIAQGLASVLSGDVKSGFKEMADGALQAVTGVTNLTDRLSKLGEEITAGAKAGYEMALALDDLEDRERAFAQTSAEAEKQISKLLIAAKNRTKGEQERLDLLEEAGRIEKANFQEALGLAKERLKFFEDRNAFEQQYGQLSDDMDKERIDAAIKVINLEKESLDLQEKIANRRDVLIEELIQKEAKAIQERATLQEAAEKERFIRGELNETQLQARILEIQGKSLNDQKALLTQYGKDTVELEKAITEDRLAAREGDIAAQLDIIERQKKLQEIAAQNEYALGLKNKQDLEDAKVQILEDSLLKQIDLLKKFNVDTTDLELEYFKLKADLRAKDEEASVEQLEKDTKLREQELEDKKAKRRQDQEDAIAVAQASANLFSEIVAYQNQLDQDRVDRLEANRERELKIAGDNVAAQDKINKDYDTRVRELRRKQAEREKRLAIFQAIIGTAQGVVQALSSTPPPLSFILAALVAAAGAVQVATISSKQIPAYNKGTKSVPGTGNKDTVQSLLTPQEMVIPVATKKKYGPVLDKIFDNKIDPNLLNGIAQGKYTGGSQQIVKDNEDVVRALKDLPLNVFEWDEDGYRRSERKKNSRTVFINSRYRSR